MSATRSRRLTPSDVRASRGRRAVLVLLAALLWPPAAAAAEAPAAPAGAPAAIEASLDSCSRQAVGSGAILVDCAPGFATAHDRVTVYPRGGVPPGLPVEAPLDSTDAVWVFDIGAQGRAKLIIDFHRDAAGHVVADLYDDGDGDGEVDYILVDGLPTVLDGQGRWSVRVIGLDGWWVRDGLTDFNLDILVDGPVHASFGSAAFVSSLRRDGVPDFMIHVRDKDGDGRPDYEWRQFYPPLPEEPALSGHYRTEIMSNEEDDEVALSGSLFWPFLAQRPELFLAGEYVKGYGVSPPPIEMDWDAARIVQLGEFVASRGNPGNYFIYSINRVVEGSTTATNFENPFAFYDLAGARDGWPDMTIRFEPTLPNETTGLRNPDPINVVEYTWDQEHDHTWNYAINLVGHQAIDDQTIDFPEFSVHAIPPSTLPGWIAGQTWDAATFVALHKPYWTTEHVYEYTVEAGGKVLPLRYLTGLDPNPPTEVFSTIDEGMQGEYSFDLDGPARLYLSPVDRRLHLLGATGGVWNLGGDRVLRYENLGGRYLNRWTLEDAGRTVASLYLVADQAVYATEDGVWYGDTALENPIIVAPPGTPDEWTRMRGLLEGAPDPLPPDDLRGIFGQVTTSVTPLPNAELRDLRLTLDGFTFLLASGSASPGPAWLKGYEAGEYAVTYNSERGYAAAPPTPATLRVSQPEVLGSPASALEKTEVSVAIHNDGDLAVDAVAVTLAVARAGGAAEDVASTTVRVPGRQTTNVTLGWVPEQGGDWEVQARVGADSLSRSVAITIAPAPDVGVVSATGQDIGLLTAVLAVLALAFGVLLVGATGRELWRRRADG